MSFPVATGLIPGLLQFFVAGYALRLNRIFGTARVGWSLFWAFSLLALLHFVKVLMSFNTGTPLGDEAEVIFSLASLLLLIGMIHNETLLRERLRVEQVENRMQDKLEFQVKEKTAHLTRAIEDLQLEIAERERLEGEVKKNRNELFAAARRAGMAEIADCVLNDVGNILKSVNASTALIADQVKQFKISSVVHIGSLLREHAENLGDFMLHDPRGLNLPVLIAQLAQHLAAEQAALTSELDFIRKNIEHLKTVVESEQDRARLADETTVTKATAYVEAAILKQPRAPAPPSDQA
jgi:hypothetical protein